MRIAYISFEYPPDTAVGGIATYVYQVSQMMKSRGHDVEVFCASTTRSLTEEFEGLTVHRVQADIYSFPKLVVPVFQKVHEENCFDLIESPEYNGDGYEIKKKYPKLPLVVKLHTPASFIIQLDSHYAAKKINNYKKFRFILGGWMRGESRKHYWKNWGWRDKSQDIDYLITAVADQIHTPSISLGDVVSKKWDINRSKILNVPYPFVPTRKFLELPLDTETKVVTYIGRLEIRKGIIELVKAIPLIIQQIPEVKFNIIGRTAHSIVEGMSMKEYIEKNLSDYLANIHFKEVTAHQIPDILATTDVCVFPSIWENFPNVCLEAMSAGKAIVGSVRGGMKDMLETPEAGVLVNPLNPVEIASAVIDLLNDKQKRIRLGGAARQSVLNKYNTNEIGSLMEQQYTKLIK